jgi:hypothetical protein
MGTKLQIELARGADRAPLAKELAARGLDVHEPRNPCRLAVEGASAEELEHLLEGWVPPDEATLVPVAVSRSLIALRPPAG